MKRDEALKLKNGEAVLYYKKKYLVHSVSSENPCYVVYLEKWRDPRHVVAVPNERLEFLNRIN